MIKTTGIKLEQLRPLVDNFFAVSGPKIRELKRVWKLEKGAPVFTRHGKYTARGWTEWTQGFLYGCRILQFDATDDEELLDSGRQDTLTFMAPHVTHIGVHDHGFNNLSTYGNLRRLALESAAAIRKNLCGFMNWRYRPRAQCRLRGGRLLFAAAASSILLMAHSPCLWTLSVPVVF